MSSRLVQLIVGFLLLIGGIFFTFKPQLSYQKETSSDILAVVGIVLMILGVVILLSPFLR